MGFYGLVLVVRFHSGCCSNRFASWLVFVCVVRCVAVRCALFVVGCKMLWFIARCLLFVASCCLLLVVVCCLLFVVASLFLVVGCWLSAACF